MEIIGNEHESSINIKCISVEQYPGTDNVLTLGWLVSVKDTAIHGVFTATDEVSVMAADHARFLDDLKHLDITRHGHITLTGCSPEEFRLELFHINQLGHLAVRYQVGCHRPRLGTDNFRTDGTVTLSGAFEIDVEYFPRILRDFVALATPAGE